MKSVNCSVCRRHPQKPLPSEKLPLFNKKRVQILAVLNITPDSFSDGGRYLKPAAAVRRAIEFESEGADILDIGGESSRPGAVRISSKEERSRIVPVIRRLRKVLTIPISVDTYKPDVAKAALDEGVHLINDIRGLHGNASLAKIVARYKAGIILMHMRGTPRTMQQLTQYKNLRREVARYLHEAVQAARAAGIAKEMIAVDPGFGFGKTVDQNLELLANLDYFGKLGYPVVAGLSRKSFIGRVLGAPVEDRLYGSLAAAAMAVQKGAGILRVHDVRPHRHLVDLLEKAYGYTHVPA